jgi:hypothetical protein
MSDGAVSHLGGEPEPPRVQAIQETGETLPGEINLLEQKMQERSGTADQKIIDHKAVELMSVNRDVTQAGETPAIFLIHLYAD